MADKSPNHQMCHVGPFDIIKVNDYPNQRDDQWLTNPQIIKCVMWAHLIS